MIAIPAVDLRGGACVQLIGGSFDAERLRLDDPAAVARGWVEMGFARLHVVDLDAAMGTASNAPIVEEILASSSAQVQVGGGVRSSDRIDELIAAGAAGIIVGTRAIEDPAWLAEQAVRHPNRIVVAADVRGRRVSVRGWTHTLENDVIDVAQSLRGLPIAGLLVTAVDVEGQMRGPALALTADVARATTIPVIASGGIGSLADLRALADCGAAAAVIGMALYTNTIDAREVAREFSA